MKESNIPQNKNLCSYIHPENIRFKFVSPYFSKSNLCPHSHRNQDTLTRCLIDVIQQHLKMLLNMLKRVAKYYYNIIL